MLGLVWRLLPAGLGQGKGSCWASIALAPAPHYLHPSFQRALLFLTRVKHPHEEQVPAEMEEVSKFLPSPGSVLVERFTPWTTFAPSSEPGASVAMATSLGKSYGESADVFLALSNEI